MGKNELPASITEISGGITVAAGFKADGIKAGIKQTGKPDLALLFSEKPCTGAGTFTKNAIRASSVDWCEEILPSKEIHAIICNSGCANACTGDRGLPQGLPQQLPLLYTHKQPFFAILLYSTGIYNSGKVN
jgi:glutamate N-acetyltransferase/amino-acid N-acetyltransferase